MADPQRLDTVLKLGIATLLVAIVALGGWFGYSVYRDRIAAEDATPALRIMKVIKAQVDKSPNDAVLRVRLGEALAAAGRTQQAIEQLNAALKIDPKHTGAYTDLGLVALMNNRPDEARDYFKKVVELTSSNPMADSNDRREIAFFNLGKLEMSQKNYDPAIGYFKEALRIRNDASDTYFFLAESLNAIGQPQEAKQNVAIALKFDPNFAQAHYLLGKLLLADGDKVRASAEIGKALTLSPTAPEPKALAQEIGDPAQLAAQAQSEAASDPEAALTDATIAFNLDPIHNVAAGKLEAKLLLQRGNKAAALAVYKTLSQISSASKDAQVLAAIKKLTPKTSKPSTSATPTK